MNCKDVDYGTYKCACILRFPFKGKFYWEDESMLRYKDVNIDKCLVDEILNLWNLKIKTTGCCCGHDKDKPFISVGSEFKQQMIDLGYIQHEEFDGVDDKYIDQYFIPKSKLYINR